MEKDFKEDLKKILGGLLALVFLFFTAMYFDGKEVLEEGGKLDSPYNTVSDYKNISAGALNSMILLKEANNFFFVNANDEDWDEATYIDKTDAFISYLKIIERQEELPENKDTRVVVYSHSGNMSKIAAKKLILLGYKNVFHLEGGIDDWREKGFEAIVRN